MIRARDTFSLGFTAVFAGAIAIGAAPIFMRLVDVSPSASAFWRVTLSLPFLFAWAYRDYQTAGRRRAVGRPLRDWAGLGIVGGLFALELFLWHQSVARTSVANATLLANMATVFAALYGFLFFRERFGRAFLGSLTIALAGAGLLIGQNVTLNPHYLSGDILGVATATAYAGYIVSAARARASMPVSAVMFSSAAITAVVLGVASLFEDAPMMPTALSGWLPLIGLALVSHVVGQSLIIFGLAHVPATLGAGTLLIQPVIAAILAWALFGEALGPMHLAGAHLIFAGVLLAKKSLQPRETEVQASTSSRR